MAKTVKCHCPVCGSSNSKEILSRINVPVHQHLLYKSKEEALNSESGDLTMLYCCDCSFVYNSHFDIDLLNYSGDYDNTVISERYDKHIKERLDFFVNKVGIVNKRILEIGCGNGSFLKKLVGCEDSCFGIGYDPCYVGPTQDNNLLFRRGYYPDKKYDDLPIDIIICRHLVEHLEYPNEFFRSIKNYLYGNEIKLFIETPCVDWILDNKLFFDFFYEHCSLFSKKSLTTSLVRSGFYVNSVENVFDGQYLWVEAELPTDKAVEGFKTSSKFIVKCKNLIKEKASYGGVAVLGAAAKGVSFVNEIDPECSYISCVIEDNPIKQGGFIPGSGHSIVSFNKALDYNLSTIIVTNPNYFESVLKKVSVFNSNIEVVSILEEL